MVLNYLIAIVAFLLCAGCRPGGVSYHGQKVKDTLSKIKKPDIKAILPKVSATPIELPGILGGDRTYFQTRSVMNLKIKGSALAPGDSLELLNDSTNASLVKENSLSFGLNGGAEGAPAFGLAEAGYDFTLTIYPLDPNFSGKFNYGDNKLRLLINDQSHQSFASNQVNLHDFTFFGVGSAVFTDSGQRQSGFQGRVSHLVGPIISNSHGELTTGLIGMSNR